MFPDLDPHGKSRCSEVSLGWVPSGQHLVADDVIGSTSEVLPGWSCWATTQCQRLHHARGNVLRGEPYVSGTAADTGAGLEFQVVVAYKHYRRLLMTIYCRYIIIYIINIPFLPLLGRFRLTGIVGHCWCGYFGTCAPR